MEIWKEIRGFEGKLAVSDMGRVKSFLRNPDGNILRSQTDGKGYQRISCTINGVKITFKVHRIVADTFIPNPEKKPQVNHKNGDKMDNSVSNLEWATNRENAEHAVRNGLWESVFAVAQAKNDAKKTPIIATNIETGETIYFSSMCEAQRALDTKHINQVIRGNRKQAKGYTFRYAKGGDADVAAM